MAAMAERWSTPEEIRAARAKFEAAIPGWRYPVTYGVGRRVGSRIEFARVDTELHKLPAVILATVCGHTGGSASYIVDHATFDHAIELLTPAEADTSQDHPNLWAWRRFRATLSGTDEVVAVFDADPTRPSDHPDVLAMRAEFAAGHD
jgi:hypothetical protein